MNKHLTESDNINWDLQTKIESCDHSPCWRRVVAGKSNQCSALILSPLSSRPPVQLSVSGGLCCPALSSGLRFCHAPAGPAGLTGGCHGCHCHYGNTSMNFDRVDDYPSKMYFNNC